MSGDRIETPVGRTSVFSGPDHRLIYRSEADLRDGLAATAWLHGWSVATEVVVPHGGRVDLLIWTPDGFRISFELKKSLSSRRTARLAFQQADGYRLYWDSIDPANTCNVLSAPDAKFDGWPELEAMYPNIKLGPWSFVLGIIRGNYLTEVTDPLGRAAVASRRHRDLAALVEVAAIERDAGTENLRDHHLDVLDRNYHAMASMLRLALDPVIAA